MIEFRVFGIASGCHIDFNLIGGRYFLNVGVTNGAKVALDHLRCDGSGGITRLLPFAHGSGIVDLPPGRYRVVVTNRGFADASLRAMEAAEPVEENEFLPIVAIAPVEPVARVSP